MPYLNVWAEVVFCGFPKDCVYTKFTMPIFCVLPSSITLPSFRCLSITVSEIREFNRKKKKKKEKKKMMNNGKSGFFSI